MNREIKEAFDAIHADEHLKQNTIHFINQKRKHPVSTWKPVLTAAACILFIIGFGSFHVYFTPTSVISMDINPSFELEINRFGKVINTEGYNEDGSNLLQSLDLNYDNYKDAIHTVLTSDTMEEYLENDAFLSIAVVEIDEAQGEEILDYISTCTENQENISCCKLQKEEVTKAHSLGLSYGKYNTYLELQEAGIEITAEQVRQMSMRELKDLLQQECPDNLDSAKGNRKQNQNGHHQENSKNTPSS